VLIISGANAHSRRESRVVKYSTEVRLSGMVSFILFSLAKPSLCW